MKIIVSDCLTGVVTERDATPVELVAAQAAYAPPTVEQRIAELMAFLRDTDYITLSDYDKDKPDVLAQRKAWREEIRSLEG